MDPKENKIVTKRCAIKGCHSVAGSGIPLHHFPTEEIMLYQWLDALEKANLSCVSLSTVICGLHFNSNDYINLDAKRRKLKKHAVPCLNLVPNDSNDGYEPSEDSEVTDTCDEEDQDEPLSDLEKLKELSSDVDEDVLGSIINTLESCGGLTSEAHEPESSCMVHSEVQTDAEELAPKKPLSCHKETQTERCSLLNLLGEDKDLRAFTGVNFNVLDALVESSSLLRGNSSDKFLCSLRERIVLTLCKLKVCLSYECLGILFGVSKTTCHKYFVDTVPLLACVLEEAVYFPDMEEIRHNSPVHFRDFQDTRIILDCTEIPVENCKCLQCRLRMYSHYKGRQTLKVLLGVTQSGLISFWSKAYGGRASDKSIFLQSGLLERLTPHKDAIMVDKGFLINKECAAKNIKVYRPPFAKSNEQMSADDCVNTRSIAAARVHVERTIQRVKIFGIFKSTFPWDLTKYIDNIMMIVCGIVNLSAPILGKSRFLSC